MRDLPYLLADLFTGLLEAVAYCWRDWLRGREERKRWEQRDRRQR
jgi:hypothetical protein